MQVTMKILIVLSAVVLTAFADEFCYSSMDEACRKVLENKVCNAQYGAIKKGIRGLQELANLNIARSYDFLLMASQFGDYRVSRPGFEKLFRKYSDDAWEDAIDVIKYIGKRGETMRFTSPPSTPMNVSDSGLEWRNLWTALDIQKELAKKVYNVHKDVTHHNDGGHDPEIMSYLEEHFTHKHASVIRELAGHINDLARFTEDADSSMSVFLFDQYLSEM